MRAVVQEIGKREGGECMSRASFVSRISTCTSAGKNKSKNLWVLALSMVSLGACASHQTARFDPHPHPQAAFEYLKGLEGQWVVNGGKDSALRWTFEVTTDGRYMIERFAVGTPSEMTTVYYLENGLLIADHYCDVDNRPHLRAVSMAAEGDLHFICDGDVGNTQSHDELHMHGVHFQKKGDDVVVWIDMLENGKVKARPTFTLVRRP